MNTQEVPSTAGRDPAEPTPPARRRARRFGIAATIALAAALVPSSIAAATSSGPTHQQGSANAAEHHSSAKPTIVLVHGAWADNSSWSGEVQRLQAAGYPVAVAPTPLRGLSEDSDYLKSFLASISGPVVLVGHSYGGSVITNAATGNAAVKALVYIDAYIPDTGQSAAELSGPDAALSSAATDPTSVFSLVPYPGAPAGIVDTYVLPSVFTSGFAGDLPKAKAAVLAASQTPTSLKAITEPSGAPAWKTIPSWALVGKQDKVIPPAQQRAMAAHAGSHVTEINSAHMSLISHPAQTTALILTAVRATN
ncbi:alpha/beta fold hydrolase [Streptomyces mirabilis]|uniref:alpha/beta fold hydrolase n=1 Tax=Streptomyces mirabilis TaxID=68239 RepID=UPI003678E0C1